jgi:hypothetical protein
VLFVPFPVAQANSGLTRTLYRLPYGYMRMAPQDVKIAGGMVQTSSSGMQYSDYQLLGNYLLTSATSAVATNGPLLFRFGGELTDVSEWTAPLGESVAARLAFDCCVRMTGDGQLRDQIGARYTGIIMRSRKDNQLELGSTDPEENDYLTARIPSQVEAPPQRQQGR